MEVQVRLLALLALNVLVKEYVMNLKGFVIVLKAFLQVMEPSMVQGIKEIVHFITHTILIHKYKEVIIIIIL